MNKSGICTLISLGFKKELLDSALEFDTIKALWEKAEPKLFLEFAKRPGILDEKEVERFGIWSARQVMSLMKDSRSVTAITSRQAYLDKKCSYAEMEKAVQIAEDATWDCGAPDKAAVWDGFEAAHAAAIAFANSQGMKGSDEIDTKNKWCEGFKEAIGLQTDWLRNNTKPNI